MLFTAPTGRSEVVIWRGETLPVVGADGVLGGVDGGALGGGTGLAAATTKENVVDDEAPCESLTVVVKV